MSLLDDARILLDESPPDWCASTREWICGFCYVRLFDPTDDDDDDSAIYESFEHNPECSWLSFPKIVAALEAAEQVTTFHQMSFGFDHTHPRYMGPDLDNCTRCLGEFRLPAALESLKTALEAS